MITRWTLIFIATALITLLVLIPRSTTVATSQAPGSPPGSPAVDLRIALTEIELTPQAIAACGLHESASTMMGRLTNAGEQLAQLQSLRGSLSTASQTATLLSSNLSSNPGNPQIAGQYQTALSNVQSLETQIAQARQSLFELATQGLSTNQIQLLTTFKQSQGRNLPPEFRVKSQTNEQWQAVELAVIAERRAQRLGQTLNSQAAGLLSELRADSQVITAAANLQAHLTEIQALIPTSTGTPNP